MSISVLVSRDLTNLGRIMVWKHVVMVQIKPQKSALVANFKIFVLVEHFNYSCKKTFFLREKKIFDGYLIIPITNSLVI